MKKRTLIMVIVAALLCTVMSSCLIQPVNTNSESNVTQTGDPQIKEMVEFYANGEKIELDPEQTEEVIAMAEYSVSSTETTLNMIITSENFEMAKDDGIAVKINYSGDERKNIIMIVSSSQGAVASIGGGSAHMIGYEITSRLVEIGGLAVDSTDTSNSMEITESNGLVIGMMIEGKSISVKEEDIESMFNIANDIDKSDENKLSVILSKGYIDAVREQGVYIELYNEEEQRHITLYLPRGHEGTAVFDDKDAYKITSDTRKIINEMISVYKTEQKEFESDPLDENVGIDITYYTKDFRTDVQTKNDIRNLLIDVTQNSQPTNAPDMSIIEGYDDIENYAYEKGVVVTIINEDAPFKAFLTQEIDGKKYDLVYLNNMYYEIDEEHLILLSDILSVTL